ncbi:interleukin-2 receptor subunit beta-like isoform X2 [Brienomyrus brachyistius]|uniref:interleukin-2 receptor subunit beta-like isoform X2 n=1 Tax=Brienomyrus brachyistius TaxID=42636 RepID=UPI0020B3B3CB|nr:interleukin-2 receptor subunit beta-like isoform X2 [Brienomyrus brachyistius]
MAATSIFRVFFYYTPVHLAVQCENFTNAIYDTEYMPVDNVKLQPPSAPNIENANVSWIFNTPLFLQGFCFQLEFKQSGYKWENAESVNVRDMRTSVKISEEKLVKGVVYDFRVRVLVDHEGFRGEWSDWSPVSSWRSTAGVSPIGDLDLDLVGLTYSLPVLGFCLILIFIIIIIIKVNRPNWFFLLKTVPDPSKFFEGNGDFKKWPSRLYPPESFSISQHSEDISPIEVSLTKETNTLFKTDSTRLPEHWESSSQSSSFSNLGYFCSTHPSSYEPCHVYFSYQPVGGSVKGNTVGERNLDSGPIQSSSSYEPLEHHSQPRHPDSNSTMEDQQTEDEEEDEDSPEATSTPTNPSGVLPFPFPCGPPLFPHNLPGLPHFPVPFPGLDLDTALSRTPELLGNVLSKSSLLSLEPSSGGYMPVKDTHNSC